MILKHKKTSQIVDAYLFRENGKTMATYWLNGMNQGKGGWNTSKLSELVPVEYETENEKHSKECQAIIDERDNMYKEMFDGTWKGEEDE